MFRHLIAGSVAIALGVVSLTGSPASAQQRPPCPGYEGRTASGACVKAGLAASLRHRSVHMDQVEINQYTYPFPPALDGTYPRGFDVNRRENAEIISVNPFPPSR